MLRKYLLTSNNLAQSNHNLNVANAFSQHVNYLQINLPGLIERLIWL